MPGGIILELRRFLRDFLLGSTGLSSPLSPEAGLVDSISVDILVLVVVTSIVLLREAPPEVPPAVTARPSGEATPAEVSD